MTKVKKKGCSNYKLKESHIVERFSSNDMTTNLSASSACQALKCQIGMYIFHPINVIGFKT